MENTIEEFKKIIKFKDSTEIGDVVLMLNESLEDGGPFQASYAVVTDFVHDDSKKDEWWFVHLVYLGLPPQHQVLILQTPHFTGQEIFTIGGKKVFIKALDCPAISAAARQKTESDRKKKKDKGPSSGLKVIK